MVKKIVVLLFLILTPVHFSIAYQVKEPELDTLEYYVVDENDNVWMSIEFGGLAYTLWTQDALRDLIPEIENVYREYTMDGVEEFIHDPDRAILEASKINENLAHKLRRIKQKKGYYIACLRVFFQMTQANPADTWRLGEVFWINLTTTEIVHSNTSRSYFTREAGLFRNLPIDAIKDSYLFGSDVVRIPVRAVYAVVEDPRAGLAMDGVGAGFHVARMFSGAEDIILTPKHLSLMKTAHGALRLVTGAASVALGLAEATLKLPLRFLGWLGGSIWDTVTNED